LPFPLMRAFLLLVTLMALLSSTAFGTSSRFLQARADLQALDLALRTYHSDTGRYPTAEEGLALLVQGKSSPANPQGRIYCEDRLRDPWGGEYQYLETPPGSSQPYRLFSFGRDSCSRTLGSDPDDVRADSPLPKKPFSYAETFQAIAFLLIYGALWIAIPYGFFSLVRLACTFRRHTRTSYGKY